MTALRENIEEAVAAIQASGPFSPCVGIVLGTGLGPLVDRIDVHARLDCADVPHFPETTLAEHAGEIVFGSLAGKAVVVMSGRYHYYEGYTLEQVTFPVRVIKALGADTLVVSNAAGGLNPQFAAGDLMVITDHINLMGDNPLIGPNDDELGPRYPDMCEPYTKALIDLADEVAREKGLRLQRGVYLACAGPCLETRAEYRFMRGLGADAVGMSTVPEVIVAVHAGLKVLGFSAITDECLPDALEPADIEKIIETAKAIEPNLTEMVFSCIERIEP